jgi:hypothetical protein
MEQLFEAILTIIALIFFEETIQTGNAPKYSKGKRKGETKELLDWSFFQLLDVAKKVKWVPEELEPEHSIDPAIYARSWNIKSRHGRATQ